MTKIVVRYRPRAEQADHNQRLVEAVYTELAATKLAGFAYTTLRLADGTFIHIADVDPQNNPLSKLPAFAAFLQGIEERCEPGQGPSSQPSTVVGTYSPETAG
jgi:hypothetical protein